MTFYIFFKGYIVGAFFTMSLSATFFILHWNTNPTELTMNIFGIFGLLSMFGCHCVQIRDIVVGNLVICCFVQHMVCALTLAGNTCFFFFAENYH